MIDPQLSAFIPLFRCLVIIGQSPRCLGEKTRILRSDWAESRHCATPNLCKLAGVVLASWCTSATDTVLIDKGRVMRILVTGGAGYIGSHALLQLLRAQHDVTVLDNFSNGTREALQRVKRLANRDFAVFESDVRDTGRLHEVFQESRPEAVIHFAGLKSVAESETIPMEYYSQNVGGSVELLRMMKNFGCSRLVFSSSATVYGESTRLPYSESHPLKPVTPYGRTKYFVEEVIRDWALSWPGASAVLLRYFNPAGADPSGQIGEDSNGIPNNLLPYISQVAAGRLPHLSVFGDSYDTRDGTGERDYIHVVDLARAHLAAVDYAVSSIGCEAINLGTGTGATVLEMVSAFEKASGKSIPYKVLPRRKGDVSRSVASVDRAQRLLGWKADLDITDICETTWRWQSNNLKGYQA